MWGMERNFCRVYLAYIKDFRDNQFVPDFIRAELQHISSPKVIDEKRAGYGLLQSAVQDVFGYRDDFHDVFQTDNRKPMSPKYSFSISHSGMLCAVALSNKNVGVDIEKINLAKDMDKLKKIILHEDEKKLSINTHEKLFVMFTQKEAMFKFNNEHKVFLPQRINTQTFDSYSTTLKSATDIYALSCVGEAINQIQLQSLAVDIVLD